LVRPSAADSAPIRRPLRDDLPPDVPFRWRRV